MRCDALRRICDAAEWEDRKNVPVNEHAEVMLGPIPRHIMRGICHLSWSSLRNEALEASSRSKTTNVVVDRGEGRN